MNKLYAQSMCSVKQWPAYQAAESMVPTEVDEVRSEADDIEPGWSQVCFYFGLRGGSMSSIVYFCSHYKRVPDGHCFLVLILLDV
jgi:hypothetical protein